MFNRIGRASVLAVALTSVVGAGVALAHEHREVGEYSITVGFMDEPVFTGQKSGLEFEVAIHETEEPVEGLEETLSAEVTFGADTRELEISPVLRRPGRLSLGVHANGSGLSTRSASSARSRAPPSTRSSRPGPTRSAT